MPPLTFENHRNDPAWWTELYDAPYEVLHLLRSIGVHIRMKYKIQLLNGWVITYSSVSSKIYVDTDKIRIATIDQNSIRVRCEDHTHKDLFNLDLFIALISRGITILDW